jgi:hypothetical protein
MIKRKWIAQARQSIFVLIPIINGEARVIPIVIQNAA